MPRDHICSIGEFQERNEEKHRIQDGGSGRNQGLGGLFRKLAEEFKCFTASVLIRKSNGVAR